MKLEDLINAKGREMGIWHIDIGTGELVPESCTPGQFDIPVVEKQHADKLRAALLVAVAALESYNECDGYGTPLSVDVDLRDSLTKIQEIMKGKS